MRQREQSAKIEFTDGQKAEVAMGILCTFLLFGAFALGKEDLPRLSAAFLDSAVLVFACFTLAVATSKIFISKKDTIQLFVIA